MLIYLGCRADIEQEVNGLYSFDRKEKLDSTQMKKVFDEVAKVYYGNHAV